MGTETMNNQQPLTAPPLTARRGRRIRGGQRRAAVAVEMALVMPIFMTILLGIIQAGTLLQTKNQLEIAAREGARLAAMDRNGLLSDGQTTNDKMIQDIRNYLKAHGLPYSSDDVDIVIASADDPSIPFDLDDPQNNYKLFQVRIEIPCPALTACTAPGLEDYRMGAHIIFRNARAALVQ